MLPESATCLSIGVTCGCGATFCFACKAHVHEPASCKIWEVLCAEMETAKALGELDSSKWIRENTTACTSCAALGITAVNAICDDFEEGGAAGEFVKGSATFTVTG